MIKKHGMLGYIFLYLCLMVSMILVLSSFGLHFNTVPDEIKKYVKAYPGKIDVVCYDQEKDDWLLNVNGTALYWAESRFLPKSELDNQYDWRPHLDYIYFDKRPDPKDTTIFSDEFVLLLKSDEFYENRKKQPSYNKAFQTALYDCATRSSTEKSIVSVTFLGHGLNVHKLIIPMLKKVESKIYGLKYNEIKHGIKSEYGTVQFFLANLDETQGYSWRDVSDTSNPSQHSCGIAIDILPKNWKKKNMYWRWRADWDTNWMLLPLKNRWMPAPDIIKAFENEGFIWGGKWVLWDNMHFEYRPELCEN